MGTKDDGQQEDLPAKWKPPAWTRWGRAMSASDPLEVPYGWITQEISEVLNRITLGDTRKRRTTILMIADAVASGTRQINEVLEDPRTLGHAGWYQRIRSDEEFQDVYRLCLERAHVWYDQQESRRLARRAAQVEQATDELVALTEQAIEVMSRLLLDDNVPASIRRGLITDILDRASEQTAAKVNATVAPGESRVITMRELRRRTPRRAGDAVVELGATLELPAHDEEEAEMAELEESDGDERD